MYVLFFLHLTSPGARWHLCQEREGTGASKRLTAPWAPVRGPRPAQGLLRKLAAPVREATAAALPGPSDWAPEGFLLHGRCWTVYRDQSTGVIFRRGDLTQCTGGEGSGAAIARPHMDIPKTCREPLLPTFWKSAFEPACEGVQATQLHRARVWPAPGRAVSALRPHASRPPKCSRLFVCLGDFRKRHAGLSGYWYCLFTL